MTTQKKPNNSLFLKIPAERAFIRLAPTFVGEGARGLGLDEEAANEISLAAEEVMAYLVRVGSPGGEVEIRCAAGSHYVQADFSFPLENIGLHAFNMTATVAFDDESGMDEMELLIASRMADQFRVARRPNGNLELTLIKDFSYPVMNAEETVEVHPLSLFSLLVPDTGQIKWFLRLINQVCPASSFPRDFLSPGKIVDMAAAGEYRLLLAVSKAGEIGGGIVWRWEGLKTVELFGPYIFHPQTNPDMARQLIDGCIGGVARTSALVLINRMLSAALPAGYLEPLGAISMFGVDGQRQTQTVSFREMHEDTGAVAWAHPELLDFLEKEYRRLYFPREIRQVSPSGEAGEASSVLSAEMDRRFNQVTLRPLWPGDDRLENLRNHLDLIKYEGFSLVFFEMDLGSSWQAEFTPDLLQLGFTPQMILPHAGIGDLLIFELPIGMP